MGMVCLYSLALKKRKPIRLYRPWFWLRSPLTRRPCGGGERLFIDHMEKGLVFRNHAELAPCALLNGLTALLQIPHFRFELRVSTLELLVDDPLVLDQLAKPRHRRKAALTNPHTVLKQHQQDSKTTFIC